MMVLASARSLGAFSDLGGTITIEERWDPISMAEAETALLEVAGYLENVALPLLATREILIEDTRRRFATETDPSGQKWYPLDTDYLDSKVADGYPEDILVREGTLEAAATSEEAWIISDGVIAFNTAVLPDYGAYHQSGTGDADLWGQGRNYRDRLSTGMMEKGSGPHDSLDIGRGQALPQREFIGISEMAIGEIGTIFDLWFDETASIFVHPTTGIAQERTPSGRFGAKLFGR